MTKQEIYEQFKNCSSKKEVKALYFKLAKVLHPDVGGSDIMFKYLNMIYSDFKTPFRTFLTVTKVKTKSWEQLVREYKLFTNHDYYDSEEIEIPLKNGENFYLNEEMKYILNSEIYLKSETFSKYFRYVDNSDVSLIVDEIVAQYIS